MKLDIRCLEANLSNTVVGLDWYDGKNGIAHALCPSLAICYEHGKVQLMCNENDTSKYVKQK